MEAVPDPGDMVQSGSTAPVVADAASEARDTTPPAATAAVDVLARLATTIDGLNEAEVTARRRQYGPNVLPAGKQATVLTVLVHQFRSAVVYLLATAAVLATSFGEIEEGVAIVAVLLINTLIGFTTEIRAVRSIEALRKLERHAARVRRAGCVRFIAASDLVPGDIVLLDAGDIVPADLRVIDAAHLIVDESNLTGESLAVHKSAAAVKASARLGDRTSMLFKGTPVTDGTGAGVVVATGASTELGRITELVTRSEPDRSPLERQLARLCNQLLWATLALAVVLVGAGLAAGKDAFLLIEASIALAVAAVPEGLPIVATLTLARGMRRMARRNALVEKLQAVETLGATTVILTDKTGTLTENRMAVRCAWVASGRYDLGRITTNSEDSTLRRLFRAALLCNTASLGQNSDPDTGDALELALLRAGRDVVGDVDHLKAAHPLVLLHPFDAGIRMMATVHTGSNDGFDYEVKGAPEAIIARAQKLATEDGDVPLDDLTRTQWLARAAALGHDGLRVLACATTSADTADAPPFDDLILLGLVGLEDPPRVDVPDAIRACRAAGIRVVMVTGDHAVTARSIGMAVGLGGASLKVVEGIELAALVGRRDSTLFTADIFARVNPAEKLDLVQVYQAKGEVVAMTGDGVNDAPALRQADIGIAMGLRGTEVAREAAAMVLLDDAFPTIVSAVREGRVIFGNIRRLVAYLLSCNLSEVMVVGVALLTTLPLPIMPLQILYLNLLTDVFPAFALAMSEGERGLMRRPPRDPARPMLDRSDWLRIVTQSAIMAATTFAAMFLARLLGFERGSVATVSFLTLAATQLWHVFNMRDAHSHPLINPVTTNGWVWGALGLCTALMLFSSYWPPLASLLGLSRPDLGMWAIALSLSVAPVVLVQATTALRGRRSNRTAQNPA